MGQRHAPPMLKALAGILDMCALQPCLQGSCRSPLLLHLGTLVSHCQVSVQTWLQAQM